MEEGQGSAGTRAKVSVRSVEQLIEGFAAVEGARIVLDDWGAVQQIHVLADDSRPPKAIARDIQSGLQARWGLVVDHRRISIAQMEDVAPRPQWSRLRLEQFAVSTDPVRGRIEIAVSLAPDGGRDATGRSPLSGTSLWQGRAAGASGAGTGLRLASEATLQALNQALRPDHAFSVADIGRMSLGGQEIVVCLLQYHAPRGAVEMLSGSALVRSEPLEAAVRAVLNASNRSYGIAGRRLGAGSLTQDLSATEAAAGQESEDH